MAMAAALLVLLVAAPAVAQALQHTVGGTDGWSQTTDFTTWSAGETFTVGDTLLFNYGGSHSVAVVSQSDYNSCSTGNAIKSYSDGTTTISLDKAGPMYFACQTLGHCQGGMKLAINVVAASTTPSSGTPPATPSGTPSSTPTSTTTPTTSTTASPHPYSGAAGSFGSMNLGFSIVLAAGLLAFMG